MSDWQNDLRYDFSHRWPEALRDTSLPVPEALWGVLDLRLGDFRVDLVHPLDSDSGVRFLLVAVNNSVVVVDYDPETRATDLVFADVSQGGRYRETTTVADGRFSIRGEFTHDRLDEPMVLTYRPIVTREGVMPEAAQRAAQRSEQLVKRFRDWSARRAAP